MMSLTQVLGLAAAAFLVAVTAASVPAFAPVRPYERTFVDPDRHVSECGQHRRAISRRACIARLDQETEITLTENE